MTYGLWLPFPLRASHSCISKAQLILGQAQAPQLGARPGEVVLLGIGKGCTSVKLEACQAAGSLRPRHSSPAQPCRRDPGPSGRSASHPASHTGCLQPGHILWLLPLSAKVTRASFSCCDQRSRWSCLEAEQPGPGVSWLGGQADLCQALVGSRGSTHSPTARTDPCSTLHVGVPVALPTLRCSLASYRGPGSGEQAEQGHPQAWCGHLGHLVTGSG